MQTFPQWTTFARLPRDGHVGPAAVAAWLCWQAWFSLKNEMWRQMVVGIVTCGLLTIL